MWHITENFRKPSNLFFTDKMKTRSKITLIEKKEYIREGPGAYKT